MKYFKDSYGIAALNLSNRLLDCLRNAGINTVGALKAYSIDKLAEICHMDEDCFAEIQMFFDMESEETSSDLIPTVFDTADIGMLSLSVRPLNCLYYAGIHTIGALRSYSINGKLEEIPGMNAQSVAEIQEKLQSFIGESIETPPNILSEDATKTTSADFVPTDFDESSIEILSLSVRPSRCLQREGIRTIGDLRTYSAEKLSGIHNMGAQSVAEVQQKLQALLDGKLDVPLRQNLFESQIASNGEEILIDSDGNILKDVAVDSLPLSKGLKNSLQSSGITMVSQLIGITSEQLGEIRGIGGLKIKQVLTALEKIPKKYNIQLVSELADVYGGSQDIWLQEFLKVKKQYPQLFGEAMINCLYQNSFVRDAAKKKIILILEKNNGEVNKRQLENNFPQHLYNTCILEELLLELELEKTITIDREKSIIDEEQTICRRYPSITQFADSVKDERTREMLRLLLSGKSLDQAGQQYDISRERVRQIINKVLQLRPRLQEDVYIHFFSQYYFSESDFSFIFNEPLSTYCYLKLTCDRSKSNCKPIEEILNDPDVPVKLKSKVERIVYKQYIVISGVRIKKERPILVKYYTKEYCKRVTKYDDFVKQYHAWLDELGLGENTSLMLNGRTYENHLQQAPYVLWNQWRSFRYYDIEDGDYEELLSTLDLEQYENIELSTLKFFRDYPELMQRYDIRDEYELHNLLKKIWPTEKEQVIFKKMPTIVIGKADSNSQIWALLQECTPISSEDFGRRYEEEYGVKSQTVLANYMKSFDQYFYNGVYSIPTENLPKEQVERMISVLTADYYPLSEIKRLFQREFPKGDVSKITPYTIQSMGFRAFAGYTGYAIKNTYQNPTDYFRTILTQCDVVDSRDFPRSMLSLVTYGSEMYKLRKNWEIIEFSPLQYINIRRLNEYGITVEDLQDYGAKVADFVDFGTYFTIQSLRNSGFIHPLDDIGFDDWFYSSLLAEDQIHFSFRRMGKTRLFLRKEKSEQNDVTLGSLLEWIIYREQKLELYDLQEYLESEYGLIIPRDKLLGSINNTNLYYDSIMETVYTDYDSYFEEI